MKLCTWSPILTLSVLSFSAAIVQASASSSSTVCDGPFVMSSTVPGVLIDSCSRLRYFRGINSVIKSFPYYPEPDQFLGYGASLSHEDRMIWQSMGMNIVRLGHLWSGTVPNERGIVNTTYLSVMTNLSVTLHDDGGIYTLIDAHQDVFSPAFCEDGAPAWAANEYAQGVAPFPAPLGNNSNCSDLTLPWAEYYFTEAVAKSFQVLYTSTTGLTDYSNFWNAIIQAYALVNPAVVVGYELINEPFAGDVFSNPLLILPSVADKENLQPFYNNVTQSIRAMEHQLNITSRPVFLEPVTWDNMIPAGFDALPGANEGLAGFSYHYYSAPDIIGSAWQIEARAQDAIRLNAVGMLTEFDIGLQNPVNAPYTYLDLRSTLDSCDKYGHGYIGWAWESMWYGNGSFALPQAKELSRPYPFAIAGTNATWNFNATQPNFPVFTLNYVHNSAIGNAGPTEIFISTGLWYPEALLNVSVVSNPPNAVTWSLQKFNGTVAVDYTNEMNQDIAVDTTPFPSIEQIRSQTPPTPPVPFAYALLFIHTAGNYNGVSASVAVSITVN